MTNESTISPELLDEILTTYEPLGSYRLICAIYKKKCSAESFYGWLTIYSPLISEQIGILLSGLSEKEATVLKSHYGLMGQIKTYHKIGYIFDRSRHTISKIKNKAVEKLQHPSRLEELSALLEDLEW